VPFRLTARLEGGDDEERSGTLLLRRTADSWRVTGVEARAPGEEVPSEGGPRPASANASQWFGAVVIGLSLMVLSALVIGVQPRSTAEAPPG
jgi:hypothetical protein